MAGLPEELLPLWKRQASKKVSPRLQALVEHVEQGMGPVALGAPGHDAGVEGLVLGRLEPWPRRVDGDGPLA